MNDGQFFKILAHNDTGQAVGHQGGIVIPKDIAQFFPPILFQANSAVPTSDVRLAAKLYVDGVLVGSVMTRYQFQTWGATRSPERRLTDNLAALRNAASKDDLLIFEKDLIEDNAISLFLVTKASPEYAALVAQTAGKRWGILDAQNPPISVDDTVAADAELSAQLDSEPSAFSIGRAVQVSTTMLRARDRAFRLRLLAAYDYRCAFTGRKFADPRKPNLVGIDAAHIVPIASNGSDDPANGLPLSKDLHWAFDRGLIGVDEQRRIVVPPAVAAISGNEYMRDIGGSPMLEANTPRLRALDEAFAWHRHHTLIN
jgi:putative restriction endonuclease